MLHEVTTPDADSDNGEIIRLRVWIANEHGYELNHCHIDVPAEDLIACDIEDLEAVEVAKQELLDDYVDTLIKGVERVRDREEHAANDSHC